MVVSGISTDLRPARLSGCQSQTKTNWTAKLEGNVVRDTDHQLRLRKMGWKVTVIWECETKEMDGLSAKIEAFLTGDSPITEACRRASDRS